MTLWESWGQSGSFIIVGGNDHIRGTRIVRPPSKNLVVSPIEIPC